MDSELETIGEQRAHRYHVGIRSLTRHHGRWVAFHLSDDVERLGAEPSGIANQLKWLQLIGKGDEGAKRHVGRLQSTTGEPADARTLRRRLVRFDRGGLVDVGRVGIGRLCRRLRVRT